MKHKKIFALFLSVAVVVSAVSFYITAYSNDVGYYFDSDTKTLYITGSGDMDNYADESSSPWHSFILSVENVVVEEGVTSVGDYAFSGASALANVSLADTVSSVGSYAFASCPKLNSLYFGSNVTAIADLSFAFNGNVAKSDFALSCDAGSYALYYCCANNVNFDCDSVKCGTHQVNIAVKGMKAYYPYTAKVSGTFKFYSSGNYDTMGALYDSSMKRLSSDDDSGTSTNFSITYELTKGETYYVCAYIFSTVIGGKFDLTIEPVQYSVTGTICAMADRLGNPSDMILTDALIDGNESSGEFDYTITQPTTVTITADDVTAYHTFSPDDGDVIQIPIMMCDRNNDGVVNAKDYAIMKKSNSKYLQFFNDCVTISR
jgi:hypothetical protein